MESEHTYYRLSFDVNEIITFQLICVNINQQYHTVQSEYRYLAGK